jgi:hypothetical protein
MFAGNSYPEKLLTQTGWLQTAYSEGVPMGGELRVGNQSPRFVLEAQKDPNGANLDRIQIIKVWLDDGETREKVFDAVWGDNRETNGEGLLPAVGNTVDLETASYTNTIGAAVISGEWLDPEFDADQLAFYYARVLEIPTPRWPTYLAVRNNLPLSIEVPPYFQERAWTSPVYILPADE